MANPIDKTPVRGRTPVEPGFKTPDVQVTARPTDPYEQPFQNDQTAQILGTLAKLVQTGGQVAGQVAATARTEGERDALAGKSQAPGVMKSAYIAGFDKITGEHNANEYHRAIWAHLATNKDKTEEEFKAGLDEIRAKHLAANVSTDALDGFLPKAVAADEDIQKRFSDYKTAVALSDLEVKARENMDTFYRDIFTGILNDYGIPSIEALSTPEGRKAFEANRVPILQKLMPAFRGGLTGYQEKYKGTMNRAKISELSVDILTGLAITTGNPDILKFAYMKDSQGNALVHYNDSKGNPLGPQIEAAAIRAEDRGIKMQNFAEEQRRRAEKDAADNEAQSIIAAARNVWKNKDTQPQALEELRDRADQVASMPGATPTLVNDLYMIIDTAEKRRNHPAQSDIDIRTGLAFKYSIGQLHVRDVSAMRWKLAEGDYDSLLGRAMEQEAAIRLRNESGNDAYFTNKNNTHIAYERFYNAINPKNAVTGLYYDSKGAEKARDAQREFQREIVNYQATHNNMSPDIDALEKIEMKVYAHIPPYVRVKPEEVEKIKEGMVARGVMPKNTKDKFRIWGKLTSKEREVADQLFPGLPE